MAQSTCEAELYALTTTTKEILAVLETCKEINVPLQLPVRVKEMVHSNKCKSHLQIQCGQCVVDCQCCDLFCFFIPIRFLLNFHRVNTMENPSNDIRKFWKRSFQRHFARFCNYLGDSSRASGKKPNNRLLNLINNEPLIVLPSGINQIFHVPQWKILPCCFYFASNTRS